MTRPHSYYATAQWRDLRAIQLGREPVCRYCLKLGLVRKATTVDHKRPHHGRASLFFNLANLQSLCTSCHSALKQALERRRFIEGTGLDGRPRSPSHHWNQGRRPGQKFFGSTGGGRNLRAVR